MSQTALPLPLAEKTNIRNWDFENLKLVEISAPKPGSEQYVPEGAKNAIVICDGGIISQNLEGAINAKVQGIDGIQANNKLLVLNSNSCNSSISINIAKNTKLTEPLYVVYVSLERSLVHQTSINIESGAEVELVETFISNAKLNSNIVCKVRVGANAKLNSSVINHLNGENTIYYHRFTEVERDASLDTRNFIINDSNIVFEDFTNLLGKGSEANVVTVALASAEQQQNITVRVENIAPQCVGNIVNYGIVKDKAHLAINGVGKVHKGMNGSDNQQESRLLNLSKAAEAVANPFLLIDEGDITAGHAASIGQINEEQVYYLMSRGLSRQASERAIALGFLTPFANTIQNAELKKQLLETIREKLG